ncbi:MAG: hypothetical protein AAGI51_01595 [Pseudomonadota bacterium]
MIRIALTAALVPGAALAHAGPEGHLHPHGLEVVLLGAAAVAVIWLARRWLRTW